MPFDPKKRPAYDRQYQAEKRMGKRRQEPETLEAALEELRELRATVERMRKKIWALENKEKILAQQRRRRSGRLKIQAAQALKQMTKLAEKS